MQIIESKIIGKQDAERCEDAIVVTDAFVAVVDGSTSKSCLPPLDCHLSHGQIAAQCVCECIMSCTEDIDMQTFCRNVTNVLRDKYPTYRPELSWEHLIEHPEDRFTCSAIVYSRHRKEIWMIGDCHCLLINGSNVHYYDNSKPVEAVLAARRAERIKMMLADGATVDEIRTNDLGRKEIIPALKESMKAQNREYAVIDGFDIPIEKVKVVSTESADEIILASDGYPRLFPTLAETEQHLRLLLERDPLLINDYQATKAWIPTNNSFDDRGFVRVRLRELKF